MKFIVIEGLDGSGKSTQVNLLKRYFEAHQLKYKFIHFPVYDSPVYGDLIARFLRGELGHIDEVNPYLVALLYAGDRNNFKETIQQWLDDGYYVLADRYVYSNIAFQCAKLQDEQAVKELKQWILKTEYDSFKIPKPDANIFLEVPETFVKQQLSSVRTGEERDYLQGKEDIHEQDMSFQERVKMIYQSLLQTEKDFSRLVCYDEQNNMLAPEIIHSRFIDFLKKQAVL
jgi:dTMP kinase